MFTKEEYALIKSKELETHYEVVNIKERTFTLFDDTKNAFEIIENLLKDGAEVFDNIQDFFDKYPPLSAEERRRKSIEDTNKRYGTNFKL